MSAKLKGWYIVLHDIPAVYKGLPIKVDHYGIYDGAGHYYHNSPNNSNAGVAKVTKAEFFKTFIEDHGGRIEAVKSGAVTAGYPKSPEHANQIIARAEALINVQWTKRFNCEHFKNMCYYKKAYSTQVQKKVIQLATSASLAALTLYFIFRREKTSD